MNEHVRVVDHSPAEEIEVGLPDWEKFRVNGIKALNLNIAIAVEELDKADKWTRELAVVPDHIRPIITDLARKVRRVQMELKDLK